MEDTRKKPNTQDYYTAEDYDDVMTKLPEIIKEAEIKAGELLEPTVNEKREVMDIVRKFIRDKKRKIYGGTAMNEAIKMVNPSDAFYTDSQFSDIEFYSPTPVPDLVELCNILYNKKYKYVVGSEARHEETYSIFVNFQLYCDISYVPLRVYNGIKTLVIDDIHYVDPHFILIDQLRIINQPLTAAGQRWVKTFDRVYRLLRNYPLEYFNKQIKILKPNNEITSYINLIKTDFMMDPDIQETCLLSGFSAYNFYIRHAMGDRTVEQMARTTYGIDRMDSLLSNVPFVEVISVAYADTVEKIFNFLKKVVKDPGQLSIDEYFPLFQFTNYSVVINYQDIPIVKIYEADGFCIPYNRTTKRYMYVSYQYLLMMMLISKFRAHLEKNKEMYFNYGIAISNLVAARNIYLTKHKLGVINNTVFGEFRINCIGRTVSFIREGLLRGREKSKQGKRPFRYDPEQFFNSEQESQDKFDPTKYNFKNTSGNKIINPKNLLFRIDENGNIVRNIANEIESTKEISLLPPTDSSSTDSTSTDSSSSD